MKTILMQQLVWVSGHHSSRERWTEKPVECIVFEVHYQHISGWWQGVLNRLLDWPEHQALIQKDGIAP